ncbi:hypothetical protein DCAR_0207686 [Daucus carota subsp. sativus]|uniref:Uncharacterized protein n=1 Tax=Daucus carota subsp. sativus TaxID=79200 RepID=A0AAF0WH43_DAUCS|nr:hypothetical protein DCAR_0207686 [Daucus carota subsp. sativus]
MSKFYVACETCHVENTFLSINYSSSRKYLFCKLPLLLSSSDNGKGRRKNKRKEYSRAMQTLSGQVKTSKVQVSPQQKTLSTSGSVAQDVEEPADSNSKDIIEDVVVMDYAQPHRKPPIHNTKD